MPTGTGVVSDTFFHSLADRLPAGAGAIGASLLSQQTGLGSAKRRGSGELLSQKKA
jgi:hypothetical protein